MLTITQMSGLLALAAGSRVAVSGSQPIVSVSFAAAWPVPAAGARLPSASEQSMATVSSGRERVRRWTVRSIGCPLPVDASVHRGWAGGADAPGPARSRLGHALKVEVAQG